MPRSIPGVYESLGVRPAGAEFIDLHDPRFPRVLDPAAILVGVRLFSLTAIEALGDDWRDMRLRQRVGNAWARAPTWIRALVRLAPPWRRTRRP